jgi:tetratricopeptide (TPR) repeat protein
LADLRRALLKRRDAGRAKVDALPSGVSEVPLGDYAAFISYSHADQATARWLHRRIESFRFPKALFGTASPFGPLPRRLLPVFRDRDELPASSDLGRELRDALARSRFQIVLCSPKAAVSNWVNEEILSFKRLHGEGRTLALILSGEPYVGDERECFPPALRYRLGLDGSLSNEPAEPIAADVRAGKDGRRLALLKLLAGLSGTRLDALVRRDAARRQRRLMLVTAASLSIAIITVSLAVYAEVQRRAADRQRQLAERSLDFLVGTFNIANPAKENPRTITALTILDRASKRASGELQHEPIVSARLLRTTGAIYYNLGLEREAERDLRAALALQPEQGEGRARTLLELARLAYKRHDAAKMTALLDEMQRAYTSGTPHADELDAKMLQQRGNAAALAGNYVAAKAHLDQAAALYARLSGDWREQLGECWMGEGEMLARLKNIDRADIFFNRASKVFSAKFGANHVRTAASLQNQAWADLEAGRFGLAAMRIGKALAIYNVVLEGDHPAIAEASVLAGRIHTATGDTAGALTSFARARAIFTHLNGPDNSTVGDVDFYIAEAEAKAGNTAAALRTLINTKRIYDIAYGANDPDQAELLLLRARVLAGAGQHDLAARDCANAIQLQKRIGEERTVIAASRKACGALRS